MDCPNWGSYRHLVRPWQDSTKPRSTPQQRTVGSSVGHAELRDLSPARAAFSQGDFKPKELSIWQRARDKCKHLPVCGKVCTQAKGKPHTCCGAAWLAHPARGLCWRPRGQQATAHTCIASIRSPPFLTFMHRAPTVCMHRAGGSDSKEKNTGLQSRSYMNEEPPQSPDKSQDSVRDEESR